MSVREQEIERYVAAYRNPGYRMGQGRRKGARAVLAGLPRGQLLDVGAGRGELGAIADDLGFVYRGVDPVPYLAQPGRIETAVATALPFAACSFDVVACLDVLEHLVEQDIRPALDEMRRVARSYVFLTAAERPHFDSEGRDYHISKRPVAEWSALFDEAFVGAKIEFLGKIGVSPGWLITL